MSKTVRRRRRAITMRKPSASYVRQMNEIADSILAQCQTMYEQSADLDTAVRDTMASGLAYLLNAAYDCRAGALGIEGEDFCTYINAGVAQWFRDHEYTEWFCVAASRLFSTSDPRRLAREQMIVFRKKKA